MSKPSWMKNQTNVDMTYCEQCHCWLKNDPMTLRGHEGGRGHREALKRFLIDTRKRKVADRKTEDDKTRMLGQIEKDAHEAMYGPGTYVGVGGGNDLGAGAGVSARAGAPPQTLHQQQPTRIAGVGSGSNRMPLPGGQHSRPPVAAILSGSGGAGSGSGDGNGLSNAASGEEEDDVGDGLYEIDGAFFFDGRA